MQVTFLAFCGVAPPLECIEAQCERMREFAASDPEFMEAVDQALWQYINDARGEDIE